MTFNISTNPKTVASWDTINSPQAYVHKPIAAAYVHDSYYINERKSSKKSKILKTIGIVAVAAAALALARYKIPAIKDININNGDSYKGLKKVNYYIAKSGQWVIDVTKSLKFWGKQSANAPKKAVK